MSTPLPIADARESLSAHLAAKGQQICQQYGPHLQWPDLLRLLEDRAFVRYPCEIVFDAAQLLPGEFAHPIAKGTRPEDGFTMYVHSHFRERLESVPLLVLYQLVAVNYGDFASPVDAETFGSAALGLLREEYYQALCQLADQVDASGMAP